MPRVSREAIGLWECEGCGEKVQLKVNSAGRVYYGCQRGCGHFATFGYKKSDTMIQELNDAKETNTTEQPAATADHDNAGPVPAATGQPAAAPATSAKRRGISAALADYVRS